MCLRYIKHKKVNANGVSYSYVPCGKCADCRRKEREAWKFRLFSEFLSLKKQGWNVGFITLTYDEDSLPTIPEVCFKDESQYRPIPCFDKVTVREWINDIRHYCKYHYHFVNGQNVRYFIVSEYGSLTHRPHYHAILAWPPVMSYNEMHALCKHYWTKGLVGPKNPEGDSECKSFEVVGDPSHALAYCTEYVSKDIDFVDAVKDVRLYDNVRDYEELTDGRAYAQMYRNCVPFHIQSQSLGMETFKSLDDDEKQSILLDGMSLVGDDHIYSVPLYIKNKLCYDNYYVFDETGKRLCRRQASEFFERNREEIFERKVSYWTDRLRKVDRAFLEESGVDAEVVDKLSQALTHQWRYVESQMTLDDISRIGAYYLAYHGIASNRCYDIPLVEQWMLRYRHPDAVADAFADEQWPVIDSYRISHLRLLFDVISSAYSYVESVKLNDRENQDRLKKKILDFYNNMR